MLGMYRNPPTGGLVFYCPPVRIVFGVISGEIPDVIR